MQDKRSRVLFFAEGATLAHVARPFVLACELDPARFAVTFARPCAYEWLTADAGFPIIDLWCQDTSAFIRRLDSGRPLYGLSTLQRYVEADLALIDEIKPDIVVGDFRLSLSVSARLRRLPYITICDVYWSPELPIEPVVPVFGNGVSRFLPSALAQRVFEFASPLLFHWHAEPHEKLRSRFGLPSLGYDLRRCYTDADLMLFANFPDLFPAVHERTGARFLGPVAWSPSPRADIDFPPGDGPIVYVTTGSSGDSRILNSLIPVLEQRGVRTMVATAGRPVSNSIATERTRIYDFLPGAQICQRAQLVVCNGGSPTTNQALGCGVPVLGIARNLDQFLNMQAVERYGAGLLLRSDRVDHDAMGAAISKLLEKSSFTERAKSLALSAPTPCLTNHIDWLLSRRTGI